MILQELKINECWKPLTMDAAGAGDWICIEGYEAVLFVIHTTQGNASSGAVTVDKALTNAGGSESTGITLKSFWYTGDAPQTTDTYTKGTAATSITPSAVGTGSSITLVLVKAEDVTGYNYLQLGMAISSANNISSAIAILGPARYLEASMKEAIA